MKRVLFLSFVLYHCVVQFYLFVTHVSYWFMIFIVKFQCFRWINISKFIFEFEIHKQREDWPFLMLKLNLLFVLPHFIQDVLEHQNEFCDLLSFVMLKHPVYYLINRIVSCLQTQQKSYFSARKLETKKSIKGTRKAVVVFNGSTNCCRYP